MLAAAIILFMVFLSSCRQILGYAKTTSFHIRCSSSFTNKITVWRNLVQTLTVLLNQSQSLFPLFFISFVRSLLFGCFLPSFIVNFSPFCSFFLLLSFVLYF
jgi:LSD1 subclass zinc finger protein